MTRQRGYRPLRWFEALVDRLLRLLWGSRSRKCQGDGLGHGSPRASSGGPRASRHEGYHGAPASSSPQGASPAQTALAAKLAYARAERTGAGSGSGTLGLSGADFLYAALVLAGLALMGAITRRLTRASPAKGHG